jgi:hypothetical protein
MRIFVINSYTRDYSWIIALFAVCLSSIYFRSTSTTGNGGNGGSAFAGNGGNAIGGNGGNGGRGGNGGNAFSGIG